MSITVFYPHMLGTGKNYETLQGITNFQEKEYGFSFNYGDMYMCFSYSNIISFSLMESDNNDT